jgi:Flp pilus assembly protein TadD
MRFVLAHALVIAAGASLAGCAHHRAPSPADRFLLHKEAKRTTDKAPGQEATSRATKQTLAEARRLMAAARPTPREPVSTLETTDPVLAAALKNLSTPPTADGLFAVGAAYHRRGLIDQAYSYYSQSLQVDPRHVETHEALARVWRDWGLPQLGLNNAHRAIYYAPTSASASNTIGTLLHALGLRDDARRAYRTATLLDPKAGYAFNNLCYLSFVEGKSDLAISECRTALTIDPRSAAAHNNLALIYAAIGRGDLARSEFAAVGSAASAAYNMGIVYLAQSRYADAADEFDQARIAPLQVVDADRRARDARHKADIALNAEGGE